MRPGAARLRGRCMPRRVILPFKADIEGLNDSKKLSERQRNVLYDRIRACAIAHAVAFADEREIDELNILNAAMLGHAPRGSCAFRASGTGAG